MFRHQCTECGNRTKLLWIRKYARIRITLAVARLLPLVPAPLPDEHLLSWTSRLAARYGMAAPELLAALTLHSGALRHPAPTELDEHSVKPFLGVLAKRSGVQLQALWRLLPANTEAASKRAADRPGEAAWYRGWVGWCPDCAREDISAHGEVFGRAAWYSRHYLICERHHKLLTDHCPRCMRQTVKPTATAGRLRLVCRSCAIPIDEHPKGEHLALDSLSVMAFDSISLERLITFQADLHRALTGAECQGPWRYGSSADDFIDAATDLCTAFAGPPLQERGSSRNLSGLSVSDGAAGFAAAASVLTWLNSVDIGVRYISNSPVLSLFPLRLHEFLKHLSYAERVWLRFRRRSRDDRLWRELSQTCAPFVPAGGFTGETMTARSVMLLTNLRGKEFIRNKQVPRSQQSCRNTASRPPTSIVESLIRTFKQELAGPKMYGLTGKRESSTTPGRYAAMMEADISALIEHTRHQLGNEPIHAVLHRPAGRGPLHPSGCPPKGHEIIHYLQGRRRRTMHAALVRLSILDARAPPRPGGRTLDSDDAYLRGLL